MANSKSKTEEKLVLDEIQRKHKKLTPLRADLIRILFRAVEPLSARQLHEQVSKVQPTISIDSVYRNLLFLKERSLVCQINLQNRGNALFEFKDPREQGHHHHAICTICSAVFCIKNCDIVYDHLQPDDDPGFTVARHAFEVYGLCSHCQQ